MFHEYWVFSIVEILFDSNMYSEYQYGTYDRDKTYGQYCQFFNTENLRPIPITKILNLSFHQNCIPLFDENIVPFVIDGALHSYLVKILQRILFLKISLLFIYFSFHPLSSIATATRSSQCPFSISYCVTTIGTAPITFIVTAIIVIALTINSTTTIVTTTLNEHPTLASSSHHNSQKLD